MGLAYRMLGSRADAEDALQETWLKWRKQQEPPENTKAWLTRVCSNTCIDTLRRLKRERLTYEGPWLPEPVDHVDLPPETAMVPDDTLGESLQLAYMLLLERLTPTERAALLLHDVFGYAFSEIADILQINVAAARQHAARARKHLKSSRTRFNAPQAELETLGAQLYAALVEGDLDGIVRYLATDVELWADGGGKALAARNVLVGPRRAAGFLAGVFRKTPAGTRLKVGRTNGKPAALIYDDNATLIAMVTMTCNTSGLINRILAHRNPDKLALATTSSKIV